MNPSFYFSRHHKACEARRVTAPSEDCEHNVRATTKQSTFPCGVHSLSIRVDPWIAAPPAVVRNDGQSKGGLSLDAKMDSLSLTSMGQRPHL